MSQFRTLALSSVLSACVFGWTAPAQAMPGFYVAKKGKAGIIHETHVAIMPKDDVTVVSVAPDYEGDLKPFAVVMPVPADVTVERVKTLKHEEADRLEKLTAPRFMEFWEMDPCDPGPLEQEWERSKLANAETAFLGGGQVGGEKKVAKELLLEVEPQFKDGEYTYSVLSGDEAKDAVGWLKGKGYDVSDAAQKALAPYVDAGMNVLIAEVDTKRIELVGGDRAQLSPIRYWSETKVRKLPEKLGLLNLEGKQELFVYVISPNQRWEVKNYGNKFPPTNISVDFAVKERMGEYYAALQDRMLQKDPKSFLVEYAWPSDGCGHPCQNEPLLLHELLSLGGDVLEQSVPDEEKNPEPPEMTEEEKKKQEAELKELKPADRPKAKKEAEAERKEIARRKALVARQKYVVTRLHQRYDASNLPDDPEFGPAAKGLEGGDHIPKGEKMEISTEVVPSSKNQLQIRYNNFHPWAGMMKCEKPERWRWGKPPRTYRGLRKTWVAVDLTRKNRKQIDPDKVTITPIPELNIAGITPGAADAGADAGTDPAATKKKGCGCSTPGAPSGSPFALPLLGLLLGGLGLRRRRR